MPTLHGESFAETVPLSVYNVSSGESIDGVIEDAASKDRIVEVPPGTYYINNQHILGSGESVAFVGTGGRNETIFTTPVGDHEMFACRGGTLVVDNVGIDQGDNWEKLILFARLFSGTIRTHTMDMLGTEPNPEDFGHGGVSGAFFTCGGGTLELVDCKSTGPADIRHYRPGRCFIYAGTNTNIHVDACDIRNTTNGCGIYGNHNGAQMLIENSYFENCAHSQVRLIGSQHTVRNCTFVADKFGDQFNHPRNRWSSDSEMNRHVWVFDPPDGANGTGRPLIEGCHFYTRTGHTVGVVVDGSADGARVRDCLMTTDSGASMMVGHSISANGGSYTGNARLSGGTISNACIASSVTNNMGDGGGNTSGDCPLPNIVRGQPPSGTIPGGEPQCENDNDCGEGQFCDDGRCVYPTPTQHQLIIRGQGELTRYEFVVDGHVEPDGTGDLAGGDFDTIVRHDDGTETVTGVTGGTPGTGDSWVFDGIATDFTFTEGTGGIEFDGEAYSASDFPLPQTTPEPECSVDADCGPDEVCSGGECVPKTTNGGGDGPGREVVLLAAGLGLAVAYARSRR